jgi:hypothetical protein
MQSLLLGDGHGGRCVSCPAVGFVLEVWDVVDLAVRAGAVVPIDPLGPDRRRLVIVAVLLPRHGATDPHTTRTITRGSPQGFQPVSICCMDLLGVFPYCVLYRLRGVRLDAGTSGLYGCVLIMIVGFLESIIGSSPFGKNSVALGIRPDELAMDQR